MTENRVLASLLAVLMIAGYLSWHRDPDAPGTTTVRLLNGAAGNVDRLVLESPTATVTVTFEQVGGRRRGWMELSTGSDTSSFVTNATFDEALEDYARLEALRSLGRLSPEELAETGLENPTRRLEIVLGAQPAVFELGGRTSGARDFYLRREGGEEVFLLRSNLVSDLEQPRSRFMQRDLRDAPITEVASVELDFGDRKLNAVQKNRLSTADAYWVRAEEPDSVAEEIANYLQKLNRLGAVEYGIEASRFDAAAPVLIARFLDEDGDSLEEIDIRKSPDGTYLGRSEAVGRPVRLGTALARQLEDDEAVLFRSSR